MIKYFDCEIKSIDPETKGVVYGWATRFNEPDLYGDVISESAFDAGLAEGRANVPLLWQHNTDEPIGLGELIRTSEGIQIKAQLDMEDPKGQSAWRKAEMGILGGFSIGFEAKDVKKNAHGGRDILQGKIWEVSFVTFPALQSAQFLAFKHQQFQGSETEPRKNPEGVRLSVNPLTEAIQEWNFKSN